MRYLLYAIDDTSCDVLAAADERIEQLRKGDFCFRCVDIDGQSIRAAVTIHLREYEFAFDANLGQGMRHSPTPAVRQAALSAIPKLFNIATVILFWRGVQKSMDGPCDFSIPDESLEWTEQYGLGPRCHCLVYHAEGIGPTLASRAESTAAWWRHIDKYLYIRYCNDQDTLYDHDIPPHAWKTLAYDPAHADVKKQLQPTLMTISEIDTRLD